MDNEIKDVELDLEKEDRDTDAPEENEELADEGDDEFEYDDEGNIIIPEVVYDDDDDDEDIVIEDDDAENDVQNEAEAEPVDRAAPPAKKTADERDNEIARLRRQLRDYEEQAKDTLIKLGIDNDDTLTGLAELAAEADNKTTEEYLAERREAAALAEADEIRKREAFRNMIADDLAAIHAAYPDTRKYASVDQFPRFKRFGELRDQGNTPEEAYIAAHREEVLQSVAAATRQQSLNDTKNHLRSNVPKKSGGESVTMPKKTLEEWRDLFPHMTDRERIALYKKTIKL